MDFNKKRKVEENGEISVSQPMGPFNFTPAAAAALSPHDIRKLIEPFTNEQLLEIIQTAATRHPDVLDSIRTVADGNVSLRKLFIRGLSSDTTSETIHSLFSSYGELEEAIVIFDKNTKKSKGFGFITFKHVDGALVALKEPSKKIDGRMTVSQLASAGQSNTGGGGGGGGSDVSLRKIYVGNVPYNTPPEKLLGLFSTYGEVEEGPLGFDKATGKSKGFAFMIYKTEEAAKAAIADPTKMIDGQQVVCKFAADNKKGTMNHRDNAPPHPHPQPLMPPQHSSAPVSHYGVPPNVPAYARFPGGGNSGYVVNSSVQGSMGNGGYGPGPYNMGPLSGEFSGLNNGGNSMHRMPPSSAGSSGGYPDAGPPYGVSQQQHQPSTLPPRVPPAGMYQGMQPYY